jgi:hypothetical protein
VKRIICLLFLLYGFFSLHAQNDYFPLSPVQTKNSYAILSDFTMASNAITYELAKTYYLKGFITNEMKDAVSKNLDERNRLGGDFSTEIYYRHRPDSIFKKKNWSWNNLSWFAGLKNVDHINSTFTRDLFEIYFRGNKNYAGKTADFSNFNYLLLKYQQVQFGLSKFIRTDSSIIVAGAALGFNIGQQLQQFQSSNASIYTLEIGEYLDVNANIRLQSSDSLHKKFGSFNGFGASTDLFFKAAIHEKHFLFFRVSNLGFIRWDNKSAEIKSDTTFRFEGIEISNLFNFSDTVKTIVSSDSTLVQSFLTHRKYKSYTLFLPAKIEINYKRPIGHNHVKLDVGVNYIINADYIPQGYVGFDYTWMRNLVSLNLSYGGYGTWGTGIFYQRFFDKGYMLMIGSDYINFLFGINKSCTEGFSFALRRNF